ncbi:MAG: hypothetical protein A2W00_11705 [Candidatus Eisenbacteria bacterium RBG_16_71_46]|nr:MAG: hypothetical protein A2W00_11705 [Candidatus Eisenbacteria bacterium RBG_16_71_46]OGF25312.1 MAG: hypothetical protein A2V63_05785 [Candidatus Eisenbacteria bacterium RBG_19FT_COMBO_70_11]
MRDDDSNEGVLRALRLIAEHLEQFLDGDEMAFETLGEVLDEGRLTAEDLQSAALVLRSLGGESPGDGASAHYAPGKHALRVPSAEERDSLSPEAWGYLLDLRRRDALDAEQFERVLDLLMRSGVRPVGIDLARETAARVALDVRGGEDGGESRHGEFDLAN